MIADALFQDWGTGGITRGPCPGVDGREAVVEMMENDFAGWREVEWAGYHIKYMVQKACREQLKGKVEPLSLGKRHLVKGGFLWDSRLLANDVMRVILGGVEEYDKLISSWGNGSIGVLVVNVVANYDISEDFRRWHEELKGGPSDYTLEREAEGRPARERKTEYMIVNVMAYHFSKDDMDRGVKSGWLRDDFQLGMRNWDGTPRNPKYMLCLDRIPQKHLLFIMNFNQDPGEFEKEFPGQI